MHQCIVKNNDVTLSAFQMLNISEKACMEEDASENIDVDKFYFMCPDYWIGGIHVALQCINYLYTNLVFCVIHRWNV